MSKSKIEWTDVVWNPVTGCTKVSAGCAHCYAERMSKRLAGRCGYPKDEPFKVTSHPDKLEEPLKWKKPRGIFVNSMSDLFHDDVPDQFIDEVFAAMFEASHHIFMILTKRPDRMMKYLSPDNPRYTARKIFDLTRGNAGKFDCDLHWPLPNVWLGVSVENQTAADERIPLLLEAPTAVRFTSAEPLLGSLDLSLWLEISRYEEGSAWCRDTGSDLDWIITGGESGPGARPMHPDWVEGLRDQCHAAGVPFFFKQWGAWKPISQMGNRESDGLYYPSPEGDPEAACDCRFQTGALQLDGRLLEAHKSGSWGHGAMQTFRVGKKKAGRELDGRTWEETP